MTTSRFTFNNFGRAQSSTDFLTNITIFGQLDQRQHFKPLNEGKIPPELLASFLHEVTHHICFSSPVGSALFLLRMRILRDAPEILSGNNERLQTFISDYMTFSAVAEVLRPIAEGIALFAEMDAWPIERVEAFDGFAMARLFSLGILDAVQDSDRVNTFHWLLQLSRQLDDNVEAKASLLTMPIGSDRGFYLLGYLMIKTAWRAHHARTMRTSDGDQFLSYAAAYFYWDLGLVSLLLDEEERSVSGRIRQVLSHIEQRFRQFIRTNTDKLVLAFHEEILNEAKKEPLPKFPTTNTFQPEHLPAFPHLLQSVQDVQLGRDRFAKLWREVFDGFKTADGTPRSAIAKFTDYVLGRRQYINLSSIAARVDVDGSGHVRAYEGTTVRAGGKALEGIEPGTEDGSIDISVIKYPPQLIITIYRGYSAVLCSLQDVGPNDHSPAVLARIPQDMINKFLDSFERPVEHLAEALEKDGTLVKSGPLIFAEATRRALQELALMPFSSETSSTAEEIGQNGFWNILGGDAEFIRSFTRVTLLSQTITLKSQIRDILTDKGVSLDGVLAQVRDLEERWSCRLVHQGEDTLMSLI